MRKRKEIAVLALIACLMVAGCGGNAVPQEKYAEVVAERDELQRNYDALLEKYASEKSDTTIEELKKQIEGKPAKTKESAGQASNSTGNEKRIGEDEIDNVYASPRDYEGKRIRISGQIFSSPEAYGDYVYFQMWKDVKNSSKNTVVRVKKDGSELKANSYVIVDGRVVGAFDGENAFGGRVDALQIEADSVELSDYITVVSPSIHDCEANVERDQFGYKITVQRIQFAEDETRIHLNIKNNGTSKFYFGGYSAKAIQGGKQYEVEHNYNADYEQVQSELLPGAETSGVITFPTMECADLSLYFEGHSDNYDEDLEAYQFDFAITQNQG